MMRRPLLRIGLPAVLCALGLGLTATARPIGDEEPAESETPQVAIEELATAPPPVPPSIQAPALPGDPAAGKGRMTLAFEGNRRWCTFPDDRVVKPPSSVTARGGPVDRNAVYTFGYQFTVAAVERSRPHETLLLFESPVFRTAVYRQAAKVGKGRTKPQVGPVIAEPRERVSVSTSRVDPTSYIPWWQEQYRCTTLPETIDLDLDPGLYDVYLAFDILLRSGNWAHRSIGFGTDIGVAAGRATRVEARANMAAGARRDLEILGATISDIPAAVTRP